MGILEGKKVVVLGDRDGIPGPAIEECVKSTGAVVVFSTTECFVWTAAGAMDLENQARIKELAAKYDTDALLVVLGAAEAEACGLAAETVSVGDPTYAGPLAGVSLGLKAYHILELKDEIDATIYEEQISMMEMILAVDEIIAEVKKYRV